MIAVISGCFSLSFWHSVLWAVCVNNISQSKGISQDTPLRSKSFPSPPTSDQEVAAEEELSGSSWALEAWKSFSRETQTKYLYHAFLIDRRVCLWCLNVLMLVLNTCGWPLLLLQYSSGILSHIVLYEYVSLVKPPVCLHYFDIPLLLLIHVHYIQESKNVIVH